MDELWGDLDFDLDEDLAPEAPAQQSEPGKKAKKEPVPEQGPIRIKHRKGLRQLTRKASSELALETAMDWHWQEGDSYHCFSFGDVDSFSFFKMVLRQQRINYAALSTWCMAGEDVLSLIDWHKRGMIGRVDFFLGEIFAGLFRFDDKDRRIGSLRNDKGRDRSHRDAASPHVDQRVRRGERRLS